MGFIDNAKLKQLIADEKHRHGTILDKLYDLHFRLDTINTKLNTIMATQTELATELAAKTAQIRKAIDEVTAKLDALMNAVNNAPVTPELRAAADALGTAVQAADDIVPDAPA